MQTRVWKFTWCIAVASSAACTDGVAPPAVPTDPAAQALATPGPLLEQSPTEADDGWMAGLVFVRTQAMAWFGASGIAYGAGRTDFWGNMASQKIQLTVLRDGSVTASTPTQMVEFSQLWPTRGWVVDTTSIATRATCGLEATAYAEGSAAFRVLGQNLSTWVGLGTKTDNSHGHGWMNACPPPPRGGGYEDECEFCQQWFYYEDGDIVDEWWDCTPMSNSYCGERMS